ncbi:YbaB/EbfC family nucleoid-associated protein [Vaginella massiliensis]|uniref:YbaB/EbfC family nucleoid-associated protein n=1 Tax=Vaginella massiliensis TaxID=1816680 RepID=UPI0008395F4C|nr:YbaB/EbfC family nucleoid-associated protein [Vaginella massiliensis]
MFGNLMGMMEKLNGLKDKFSHLKEELDNDFFIAKSTSGNVKITLSKFATIKDIELAEGVEKEQLEDELVLTLNKALEKVKNEAMEKAKKTATENMPNIPGMPF